MQARVAHKAVVSDDPFGPMITTELDEERAPRWRTIRDRYWTRAITPAERDRKDHEAVVPRLMARESFTRASCPPKRVLARARGGRPHPNGEDQVEATVAEIQVLELRHQELCLPLLDERGVGPGGRLDHLRGPVDRRQSAAVEPLAHHRGGDPMAATDLEDPIAGAKAELVNDGPQRLSHFAQTSTTTSKSP